MISSVRLAPVASSAFCSINFTSGGASKLIMSRTFLFRSVGLGIRTLDTPVDQVMQEFYIFILQMGITGDTRITMSKEAEEKEQAADEPINARLPKDVVAMLRKAKEATGRSQKHLLSDAIRARYSKFLETKAA